MKHIRHANILILLGLTAGRVAVAQGPQKASGVDPAMAAKQSLSLAERGKCKEALQLLKKTSSASDKELKRVCSRLHATVTSHFWSVTVAELLSQIPLVLQQTLLVGDDTKSDQLLDLLVCHFLVRR